MGRTNCTIQIPHYGTLELIVTELGFGKVVASSEHEATRKRSFYPMRATSGLWYVRALFPKYSEYMNLNYFLRDYYNRISDPMLTPLLPATVRVPSRNFEKVGYPAYTLDFGDEFGKVLYEATINFVSASDPTISASLASKYAAPLRDVAFSQSFHPVPTANMPSSSRSPFTQSPTTNGPI